MGEDRRGPRIRNWLPLGAVTISVSGVSWVCSEAPKYGDVKFTGNFLKYLAANSIRGVLRRVRKIMRVRNTVGQTIDMV